MLQEESVGTRVSDRHEHEQDVLREYASELQRARKVVLAALGLGCDATVMASAAISLGHASAKVMAEIDQRNGEDRDGIGRVTTNRCDDSASEDDVVFEGATRVG